MDVTTKIKRLNKLCDNSLSITCYYIGWEVSSYHPNTPFHKSHINDKDLNVVIDFALAIAEQWHEKEKIKRGIMTA